MGNHMKGNGKWVNFMAKELIIGKMVKNMKGCINRAKEKGRELIFIKMVGNMKGCGRMDFKMVLEQLSEDMMKLRDIGPRDRNLKNNDINRFSCSIIR